jgi:nucleotide-binding universal stress UspA family protein
MAMTHDFRRRGAPSQSDVPAPATQPDAPARANPPDAIPREHGIRHILVALDGSVTAEAALESVRPLALRLAARVTLIRAISPFETAHLHHWSPDVSDENVSSVRHAESYLRELVETLRLDGVDASFECVGGTRPADIIVARASALEVDLIAVTGRGHGAGSGMQVGSTAHGIVRAAPCPVLLVGTAARSGGSAGSARPVHGIGAATDSAAAPAGVR